MILKKLAMLVLTGSMFYGALTGFRNMSPDAATWKQILVWTGLAITSLIFVLTIYFELLSRKKRKSG